MGDIVDGSTLQKLSPALLCGHFGYGEKYFNRKQLWIYGNSEGKFKCFFFYFVMINNNCLSMSYTARNYILFTAYKRFVASH